MTRHEIVRPLDEMELSLVRASVLSPGLLGPDEEAVLRTALSLARVYRVRHDDREVGLGAFLSPFRESVLRRLAPALLASRRVTRHAVVPHVRDLKERTLRTREALSQRLGDRVPDETIDREVRHKALVLVSGGGGGSGFVYLGAMSLLDEFGLVPKLLVGTSVGAVLSLFRSRLSRFDAAEMMSIVRALSWKKLFRLISTENRYGLPAALRLYLRSGIGRYFDAGASGGGPSLGDLPIPLIVTVAGIRRGMLPRPLEFYEKLLGQAPWNLLSRLAWAARARKAFGELAEFIAHPEILVPLYLGASEQTRAFDALDAVGFSCALPGIIHYDVLREDERMRSLLDALFAQNDVFRLIDGGVVDNLPARAAWRAVHRGQLGTRNAFILALNCFSLKLSTPLWMPLQRLAEATVAPNRPYAHWIKDFRRTLSPLELVPSPDLLAKAIDLGRSQLAEDIPFIARMMAPLPRLESL